MRRITKNEFLALLPLAAPNRMPVTQMVRNFVWREQYFSHVRTLNPSGVLEYVEVTTSKENSELQFPSWMTVGNDVTDNMDFTSFTKSKKD